MSGYPDAPFPSTPFVSCDEQGVTVVDQKDMSALLKGREVDYWIRLELGPGNAVDSRPIRVKDHEGPRVTIECDDGELDIDFVEETIRKTDADGKTYMYVGALDMANEAAGWIATG
ncbi:MAG: hypothetical protein ACOC5M_00825 [Chloroflexota bacterium]